MGERRDANNEINGGQYNGPVIQAHTINGGVRVSPPSPTYTESPQQSAQRARVLAGLAARMDAEEAAQEAQRQEAIRDERAMRIANRLWAVLWAVGLVLLAVGGLYRSKDVASAGAAFFICGLGVAYWRFQRCGK